MDVTIEMTGTQPLLMHNVRLADPDDEYSSQISAITGKQKKTKDDRARMSELEWRGSLYHDAKVGPYVLTSAMKKSIEAAATVRRLGKAVARGLVMLPPDVPLVYDGPRDPAAMFAAGRFTHRAAVKVGTQTVQRTRPFFAEWSATAEAILLENVLDFDALVEMASLAGTIEGLGDGRRIGFGRYVATVKPR